MWLLRLHIAISILLLLTGEGTAIIFRSLIIKNGWEVSRGFKRIINFIKRFFMYFIPFINVLTTIADFIMVFIPKGKYDDWIKERQIIT